MGKDVTFVMMTVTLSTTLALPADAAWSAATRAATFRYVSRGALGVHGPLPARFTSGVNVTMRLKPLGVLPGWTHHLHVERVDDAARELRTRERGGPLKRWDHRIRVAPLTATTSRYTDHVTIDAGPLTLLAWSVAHVFFRLRQTRWRRLARTTNVLAPREARTEA